MNKSIIGGENRSGHTSYLKALGVLVSLIGLSSPALAQPFFTITGQNRYVTASVSCIPGGDPPETQTLIAPDMNTWTGNAVASCSHGVPPGGGNTAVCNQTSTIAASSLSGSFSDFIFQDFGGGAGGDGLCSLTFTTTVPLRYDFTLNSEGNQGPVWAASLTNAFSASGSAFTARSASANGVIFAGTYTLLIQFGASYPMADLTYSLNFSEVTPAAVLAGPLSRPGDDREYYLLDATDWFTAEVTARTLGGHLVTITDASEQAWLQSTFGAIGPANKWLGLSSEAVPNSVYLKWISGHQTTFTNWAAGRPTGSAGNYAYIQPDGRWNQNVHNPAGSFGGIVEVVPAKRLPEIVAGPISNPANTRQYYQLAASSWQDAEELAVQLGGHLVTINTPAEQAWVAGTFASLGPANKWLGYSARMNTGSSAFRWASDQATTYTHWAFSTPVAGFGDFAFMRADGKWLQSLGDSDMNTGGIVETGDRVQIGALARPGDCGHWHSQLFPSSWTDAEAEAAELGGHLVTVNNQIENTWLVNTFGSLIASRKWIGLHRPMPGSSVFVWASGDSSPYRVWGAGQPLSTLDYAYMWNERSGQWFTTAAAPIQTPNAYVGIIETSRCRCDWNIDGDRTSADFFTFLTDFLTGGGDFDCSGTNDSNDFFQFLTCFQAASCP
ncbi:MAG: hypothetical protein H7210_03335 [Pyrinomonadaceae bacterium]|nr:hypothetical protein [Phycisphaerales bacterium]